jgi:hypothetical protein
LCGLTLDSLEKFQSEASPQRDRVEFQADRTYRLLEENKRQYSNKKRPGASSQTNGTNSNNNDNGGSNNHGNGNGGDAQSRLNEPMEIMIID